MDCIFCKIVKGEIPSYKVYEDEKVLVFLDIYPTNNGHMLVIPKEHVENLHDISLDLLKEINTVTKKMYKLVEEGLSADGATIIQNNGSAQDVKHYHVHVVPRFKDDGVKLTDANFEKLDFEEVLKKLK
jgi:histidine triad (HIT) family protein